MYHGGARMLKGVLIFLLVAVSIALIALVLLQSGHSAGLSGAIAGGAERIFGKKKGMDELLAKYTTICAIGFFAVALVLSLAW